MLPKNRNSFRAFRTLLLLCLIGMATINSSLLGILSWKSLDFFQHVSLLQFLTGTIWNPTVTATGVCTDFGMLPILFGTVLVAILTILVVGPLGIWAAIYLAEYMSPRWQTRCKTTLELFAGIPTLAYGLFATMVIAPLFQSWGETLHFQVAPESAIVVGVVMGIMNFPFVVSLTDEILRAVPLYVRQAGWALGSTPGEVIRQIILPTSLPGLLAVFLLALSRSIGETMIVVMAASLTTQLTLNPLNPTTTVTAQIVALLTGDESPDNPKTQAAFALGLLLCGVTLFLNVVGMHIVKRYRMRYAPVF